MLNIYQYINFTASIPQIVVESLRQLENKGYKEQETDHSTVVSV